MSTNVPVTVWRNTDGLGEFTGADVQEIVDINDVNLVDIDGVYVVDTGVIFTQIPATIWEEDDSR